VTLDELAPGSLAPERPGIETILSKDVGHRRTGDIFRAEPAIEGANGNDADEMFERRSESLAKLDESLPFPRIHDEALGQFTS
jgi:hypothetical protein